MTASYTDDVDAYRKHARAWIAEHLAPAVVDSTSTGVPRDVDLEADRALQGMLFDAGYAGFAFPTRYGGADLTFEHQQAFFDEAADRVIPTSFGVSIGMIAPTILEHGSESLKARYLPKVLRGDEIFVQLLSESSGGSDLAGVLTRAEERADSWVINGSKMWTSGAMSATHGLLLARTNWDVPKHQGLSMFVVPLDAMAGITIEPIRQVNGSTHFCQEFFDEVAVPAENLVGEVGQGWAVTQTLLFHERDATAGIGFGYGYMRPSESARPDARPETLRELLSSAARRDAVNDPATRQLIGRAYVDLVAHEFARRRIIAGQRSGNLTGQWASLLKLGEGVDSPLYAEFALAIAGSHGVIWTDEEPGGAEGRAWLNARAISIAGGSNEMQRNIISERLLEMPREHDPSRTLPFREIQERRSYRPD